ncbi:hypothetical protein, partial [Streptomyces sp. HCCB10043]
RGQPGGWLPLGLAPPIPYVRLRARQRVGGRFPGFRRTRLLTRTRPTVLVVHARPTVLAVLTRASIRCGE